MTVDNKFDADMGQSILEQELDDDDKGLMLCLKVITQ